MIRIYPTNTKNQDIILTLILQNDDKNKLYVKFVLYSVVCVS